MNRRWFFQACGASSLGVLLWGAGGSGGRPPAPTPDPVHDV